MGVESDVVAARAADVSGEVRWGGGRALLVQTRGGRAGQHFITFVHCVRAMFRADRSRYHALQVRDMPAVAAFGLLAARLKKLPFFYWMSFPVPESQMLLARQQRFPAGAMKFLVLWLRGLLGRFLLYSVVLPRADHVFVQTQKMLKDVAARGVPAHKMTAVPMGVDLDAARPESVMPSEDPRLIGRRILVYLGALDQLRRIDVLFEMMALVRKNYADARLVLVGDTEDLPHRSWLERRAEQLGVADAVIWTGWLPTHEGWRYVRAAEIGVSPIPRGPLYDCASPTKVIEYLAMGIPVVANDNPDQKRVLEEGSGGLCVPLTAVEFAHAVCRLLADGQLRSTMALAGQRYIRISRSYSNLARMVAQKYVALLHTSVSSAVPESRIDAIRPDKY